MSALPRTRVDSQAALSLAQGDYHDAEGHVMLTEDGIPVYRRTAHGRALAKAKRDGTTAATQAQVGVRAPPIAASPHHSPPRKLKINAA